MPLPHRLRLELARLQEPRGIAPENQEEMIAALRAFRGQKFSFTVFPDPEPLALVRVLEAVLTAAGWDRVRSQIGDIAIDAGGNTAGSAHDTGVTVFIGPDNRDAEAALVALSTALTAAGIPCQPKRTEQLRDKTPKAILINVGKKP